jgi:hypothetical protein
MPNAAISGLTASATNLAAADVLPVVQTTGVGPVKMTGQQLAGGLLGSTTLNGATLTASAPVLNLTQTWNNVAVTFTGFRLNVTDTASNAASLLMDLQVGGVTQASLTKAGALNVRGNILPLADNTVSLGSGSFRLQNVFATTAFRMGANGTFDWTDLILRRRAASNLQLGPTDAASATAQTLSVQGVIAGTTNGAGANFTIAGSQGTGSGAGGSIIFQVAPANGGGGATVQNPLVAALTIASNRTVIAGAAFTVATLPAAGTQGRRAWVTDATVPTFLGTLTGGGAVVCPVFDNGTAWVSA